MLTRRLLTILALAALPMLAAPNLSGTWKMNASKCDFGPMPAPDSLTRTITHDDPNLKLVTKQSGANGDMETTATYTTDGKESSNDMRGNTVKSIAKWDGDTLVVESKGKFGDNDVTITEKWTLSDGGKTLTILRHFATSMGEVDVKLVMDKQ
jgi:hypothetical protein